MFFYYFLFYSLQYKVICITVWICITAQETTKRPDPSNTAYIVDGNAVLQSLVYLPTTFGELAENVFEHLPKVPRVDFVKDSYFPHSIKGIERSRRGTSQAHLLKGPATKVPRDWKAFLRNDENKKQLSNFLLKQWGSDEYAQKLQERNVVIVTQNITCKTDKCKWCIDALRRTRWVSFYSRRSGYQNHPPSGPRRREFTKRVSNHH